MMETSWIYGLGGGLIIGLAGAIFLLVNGRIMGVSGILGGLVDGSAKGSTRERGAFLAGLVGAPAVVSLIWSVPSTNVTGSVPILVAAGLLVGVGTRIGNGCTSGHGVCGISRLSPRSISATVFYLLAGAVSVYVARHMLGII